MGLRFLIVDDSRLARALVKNAILSGYPDAEIEFADSGDGALTIIEKDVNFNAVICDYNMPGMNGLELGDRLKAYIPYEKMIMVTANAGFKTDKLSVREGMQLVEKPVSAAKLLPALQKIGL